MVSTRYLVQTQSSSLSARDATCTGPCVSSSAHRCTSLSCRELNWSQPGFMSSSQYHCATADSSSDVGVSALYSSILGGDWPSYTRSKRPYSEKSMRLNDCAMASQ